MDPAPTTPPEKPVDQKVGPSLKQIRTYQGDIASALKNQNESLVSIQRSEVEKRGGPPAPEPAGRDRARQRALFMILGTLILVVLALTGGWLSYKEIIKNNTPPTQSVLPNRFLPASIETNLNITALDRGTLIDIIATESSKDTSQSDITHIVLRDGDGEEAPLVNTAEFLNTIEAGAPSSLVRALNPLFMLGVLGGSPQSTFLIMRIESFENTFAGMLAWEATLARDLGPIFYTAPRLRNLGTEPIFTDVISRNKDVRVLYDTEGEVVLLYSFLDNEVLVITDNIETLRTLITRLTTEKLSR